MAGYVVEDLVGVFLVPPELLEKIGEDQYRFKNIPIRDYPLIITFGDFCR